MADLTRSGDATDVSYGYFLDRMILVRNRNGTLYFLAREGGEALDALRRAYPGRPLAVVKEGDGLAILRVGDVAPDRAGDERLAIVNLTLPPAPPAFSFRGRGSATPLH